MENLDSMKLIPLSRGYFAMVDDADYAAVSAFKWSAKEDKRTDGSIRNVYAKRLVSKGLPKPTTFALHRVLLGITDPKVQVDHKDGNGLNCQRYNLRVATKAGNQQNQRLLRKNKTGYKGVFWRDTRKKYVVNITVDGMGSIFLGHVTNPIEGARMYDAAALKYHGEFACTNQKLGLLPPEQLAE
jgi:hypothetical protein